jgi:hypothetical protein
MSFNICRGTLGSLAMFTSDKECLVAQQRLQSSALVSVIGVVAAAGASKQRGS